MRILIAEDDRTSREILANVLANAGHEVVETANGAEAWTYFQQPDPPRLAILDWMMPEMDGVDLVSHIRELPTGRPPYLIMLTAKGEKKDIVTALEAGADDYLAKPFDASELRARIKAGTRMLKMLDQVAHQAREQQAAEDHIKTLQGILPICSYCKKIRNDEGFWDQVEAYVSRYTEAEFTHSICPECMKKNFPDVCDDCGKVKSERRD
jgi:DNA-binding response OmpR family regulator